MGAALAYSNLSLKSVTHNRPGASCIQAKLKIGAVNDPQEQQADQVAEKVMRMPSNAGFVMGGIGTGAAMNVQRQCKNCGNEEKISRKEEELRGIDQPEILQAKAGASFASGGTAPGTVQSGIASTKGAGTNLPTHINSDLGGKMGADFSGVKIHDNAHAAKMTAHVNARAFTVGNDIYFNKGEYNPNSSGGKFLLAHELTHTIQQGATVQRKTEEKEKVLRKVEETEKIDRCACSDEIVQRWDLGDWLAESAWEIVEEIAPAEFVQLLREISSKGILGFLREKLMTSLNHLFDRFPAVGNFVTNLISVFSLLYERVSVIMQALIAGDCAPLLAAVTELKNVITTIATDAWAGLTDFVRPIGDFFSGLWGAFGAPVVDWLGQTASDVWVWMQGIGQRIWDWTLPVREYGAMAWDWVKSTLGIGADSSGAENSNGMMQWVTGKAEEAWTGIKETIRPVIEPVQQIAEKVVRILPLSAIMNLRDTVSNFASGVNGMAATMGDDGSGIAEQAQQASLRDIILPAVQTKVVEVQQGIGNAGLWVAENVGGFVNQITGFYSSIASSSIFSAAAPAIAWINDTALGLGNWVQTGVVNLFNLASSGLGYLAGFITPILNALQRIVDTIGDLAGRAGDFILGPFMLIPECIRTPIKNFLIEQILSRIPLFNQIMAIGDVWARAQQIVMTILYQVFVDGNLPGAMWTFFRELLSLVGIPPELVVSILANASQAMVDILGNPVGFFINLLSGLQQGFSQFFGNIGTHLLSGVVNWLTAEMQAMGITPPTDFSFGSIFSFILQILGVTIDNIFNLLATRIGEERAQRLRGMLDMATGAWSFVADVVERGPAAIWERIQEQLSNLWDTVIGNIVTFINERIMAQATAWLLSMLDVSGIMPVVNSILAVYRAIQSFTEYFVPILRIINQYVTMLADVARGNIAGAANFLESILANSLPIMIGFLANQFGFGRIATRMQEILESVKARIDAGILWVIDQAIRIGGAVMDAGRAAVAAVREWWNRRIGFTAEDGSSHELVYRGSETNPEMWVESTPQLVYGFLNNTITDTTIPMRKRNAATRAKTFYDTRIIPALDALKQIPRQDSAQRNQKYQDLLTVESEFTPLLGRVIGGGELSSDIMKYNFEGLVGTYGRFPENPNDLLTPDHQPQAAILIAAAQMEYTETNQLIAPGDTGFGSGRKIFPPDNNIHSQTRGHAMGGFTINLFEDRHEMGRTFGPKGMTTKNQFLSNVKTTINSGDTPEIMRNKVVDEIIRDRNADVNFMFGIINQPLLAPAWADLNALTAFPDGMTKEQFYRTVKARLQQGERTLQAQPLQNLKA